MECNKDEATRAKEIAERKFTARDVGGAKKFAVKALNLYPALEGLAQMLATLDVHLSAENQIAGEADWYGILGVNPLADDETVRKQYRKLALMLHPDKNKSVGADGAFKLISEAWSLLSDKTKRVAYDQRRFLKISRQTPATSGSAAVPPNTNGFHNSSNGTANVRSHKSSTKAGKSPAPRHSKPNTFWTACHRCKMQYEYVRMYLNHNLLCPNCHEPFLAVETAAPSSKSPNSSMPWPPPQTRQNFDHHSANRNAHASGQHSGADAGVDQSNFQWGPFSRSGGGVAHASSSAAAQAASLVQQAYEKVRREREEAQAAAKRQEAHRKKHSVSRKTAGSPSAGHSSAGGNSDLKGERPAKRRRSGDDVGGNAPKQMAPGSGGIGTCSVSGTNQSDFQKEKLNLVPVTSKPNSTRELSQHDLRNMLVEKARRDIHKKLNEWRSTAAAGTVADKEKQKEQVTGEINKDASAIDVETSDQNKGIEPVCSKKSLEDAESLVNIETIGVSVDSEACDPMSITVPDPDFHDFDRDRCEKSFGDNQVWAAYDDDDGMPRYYAMIHRVISLNPFKVRISWLNSKTNTELGPLNWTGSGFSKTCGDFRVGKYETNNSLNSFSHKVRWGKGVRGAIRIFPRMGDVWALYRNWSPDWNELTPDEVIHKYDMVEVLEDYNEEQGVCVTPLVKVAGFKTVFHRHLDLREVRMIPREEMFRFSHQVPSYLLTGSEAPGAPKGCRELDPAATPVELLQVITEIKEEMLDNAEEQNMTEAKGEGNVEIAKEERVVEIKDYKIVEIAEEGSITELKDNDTMEIVQEEKLTEMVVEIAEEERTIKAKDEELAEEERTTEVKGKEEIVQKVTGMVVEIAEEERTIKAKDKEIVEMVEEEGVRELKDKNIMETDQKEKLIEMVVKIAEEERTLKAKDMEIVEMVEEEGVREAKDKDNAEERRTSEARDEEIVEITEAERITEPNDEKIQEVTKEERITGAKDDDTVEIANERITARAEAVAEISDEHTVIEAKDLETFKDAEKKVVTEGGVDIVKIAGNTGDIMI